MGALSTLRPLATGIWRDVIAARVRHGRLRDIRWPYGLREIVTVTLAAYLIVVLLVVAGPWLRQGGRLLTTATLTSGIPETWLWLLIFLITVLVALVHVACLHGAWWLKALGLLATTSAVLSWGVTGTFTGSLNFGTIIAVACSLALIIFSIVRWPRAFRWWEFLITLGLFGTVVLDTLLVGGYARSFGFEFAPMMVQQTLTTIGFLAIPAAMVAGVAVAEIAINLTLATTRRVQRLTESAPRDRPGTWLARLPYLILIVLVLVRLAQSITELIGLDPVRQGWPAFVVAGVALLLIAGLGRLVLRWGRRHEAGTKIAGLPDELSAVGLPVAAALAGLTLPVLIAGSVITAVAALDPLGMAEQGSLDLLVIADQVDLVRLVVAALCITIGLIITRRGRPGRGLLLCCIGVVLLTQVTQLLSGYRLAIGFDLTVVNLLATALALGLAGWSLIRRRLSPMRALALSGLLVLSALVSAREVITDPVQVIFGYSGAVVLLFGLTWTFLTGSGWGNGDSRRFPRPTRVLLVLANLLLTGILLAYLVLAGNLGVIIDLEDFADFGDLVFGSALLAAAFVAVVDAQRTDRPLG
ncbi:hypothetical protein [Microlunatus speluncae]|uniref:hypothetical protein n=1 Tax=Microlunatus speluncae TaxID=2594267 RepID=UPI0012662B3E|nr:hypothetical protein [Microlunatus speluncae]